MGAGVAVRAQSGQPRRRIRCQKAVPHVVSSSGLARAADVERWLAESARLAVDLVVVASGPAARAVMTASPTTPVVTVAKRGAVRAGLVASLARLGRRRALQG